MRQITEGVGLLGLRGEYILEHLQSRIAYACELYENSRETMFGLNRPSGSGRLPSTAEISAAWIRRWAVRRFANAEVKRSMRDANADKFDTMMCQRAGISTQPYPQLQAELLGEEFA
jgi:hypothetical protein